MFGSNYTLIFSIMKAIHYDNNTKQAENSPTMNGTSLEAKHFGNNIGKIEAKSKPAEDANVLEFIESHKGFLGKSINIHDGILVITKQDGTTVTIELDKMPEEYRSLIQLGLREDTHFFFIISRTNKGRPFLKCFFFFFLLVQRVYPPPS